MPPATMNELLLLPLLPLPPIWRPVASLCAPVKNICAPLVSRTVLKLPPGLPVAKKKVLRLVRVPPLTVSTLLIALPVAATVTLLPSRFQVELANTVTVLLFPPLAPTVSPLLNSVALVAVRVLTEAPLPIVINPALVTVPPMTVITLLLAVPIVSVAAFMFNVAPPRTLRKLLVTPLPIVIAPLSMEPLVTITPLLAPLMVKLAVLV